MLRDLYFQGQNIPNGIYGVGRPVVYSNTSVSWQINALTLIYKKYTPSMVAQGNAVIIFIDAGRLFSVGVNTNGLTGQGTTSNVTLVPTQIGSDTDWTFCAAGETAAGAIRGGRLYTWGSNANGQTGQGTSTGTTNSPTQIGSDTDWTKVCFANGIAVALKAGKILTCGANSNGRLGQNLAASVGTIVNVFTELNGGSTGWTDCSAGNIHILGIKSGAIWGAGSQANGRLGNGATTPVSIINMTQHDTTETWSKVYAGNETSFAINSSGELFGTGNQTNGALGNGGTGNLGNFTQIGSDTDWQQISVHPTNAANFLNLGIARKGGKIWVTGTNTGGGLGLLDQTTITTWTKLSDITVSDISIKNYGHTLVII